MMDIITDPDTDITEYQTTFGELYPTDIYRMADVPLSESIKQKQIFMKITNFSCPTAVNMGNGIATLVADDTQVIVHVSKLVVIPND